MLTATTNTSEVITNGMTGTLVANLEGELTGNVTGVSGVPLVLSTDWTGDNALQINSGGDIDLNTAASKVVNISNGLSVGGSLTAPDDILTVGGPSSDNGTNFTMTRPEADTSHNPGEFTIKGEDVYPSGEALSGGAINIEGGQGRDGTELGDENEQWRGNVKLKGRQVRIEGGHAEGSIHLDAMGKIHLNTGLHPTSGHEGVYITGNLRVTGNIKIPDQATNGSGGNPFQLYGSNANSTAGNGLGPDRIGGEIKILARNVSTGVAVTERGQGPCATAVLHEHAGEIDRFVSIGMPEMGGPAHPVPKGCPWRAGRERVVASQEQ